MGILLKILIGALIYEAALDPAKILLDNRKTKYIVRLLVLLDTHPTT